MNVTAQKAIGESREIGATVWVDRFDSETEAALAEAATEWDVDDQGDAKYVGDGWAVQLIGDGDPR